jgi:hypothetical protein
MASTRYARSQERRRLRGSRRQGSRHHPERPKAHDLVGNRLSDPVAHHHTESCGSNKMLIKSTNYDTANIFMSGDRTLLKASPLLHFEQSFKAPGL